MIQSDLKSGNNSSVRAPGDWDVETIIAQIRRDLNRSVTLSMIQEVLNEVIPKYESARIQTFVPIFIHRDAVKRLKSMPPAAAAPVMTALEAGATNGSPVGPHPRPGKFDRDERDKTTGTGLINWKLPVRRGPIETTG